MSEMIERVARALWLAEVEEDWHARGKPFGREAMEKEWAEKVAGSNGGFYGPVYATMMIRARVAIEAMSTPNVGILTVSVPGCPTMTPAQWLAIWQRMIDEALR